MCSLCANYPKGLGDVFLQYIMDNNYGGLIFHVDRGPSGGRQDITSMAAMTIFWNRNYCVELLDEMMSYFVKIGNILVCNLMILPSSVDNIAVSCLWSILNISIVVLMSWLAECTHKMNYYGWGYISIGKVLDNLKDDLNMIVDQPELIHE